MSQYLDERLAYRAAEIREKIRSGRGDSYLLALLDWLAAQRAREQLVAEAAYFRWIDRGQRFGEHLKDWFAAEAEIASDQTARWQAAVDQCLRDQLIAEAAYFRWITRGQRFGEHLEDWSAAEAEVVNGG
jgi:hypothetical protein